MKTNLLLTILLFSAISNGQTFTRKYPVTQDTQPYTLGSCAPIIQTADGGHILNYSYGYPGIHGGPLYSEIIKTDAAFLPLWKKEIGGSNGIKTLGFSDGSSIFFENSFSFYLFSFSLEKFDSNGQTLWRKSDFAVDPYKISIQDALVKNTNTIKLAGIQEYNSGSSGYNSQPVLMDFDTNGNYIQGISLSIPSVPYGGIESMCQETSGDYYVVIKNLASRYVAKFSASNAIIWCKKLNLNNGDFYTITTSVALNNGDLLIGGNYNNYSVGFLTFALVRITTDGNLVWSKTINDLRTSISSFKELSANEIMATGTISPDFIPRSVIMKIDGNGNPVWAKKYSNAFSISELYPKSSNDWYYAAFSYSITEISSPFIFNTQNDGMATCNAEDVSFNFIDNPTSLSTVSLTTNPLTLLTPTTITTGQSVTQIYEDDCIPLLSNSNIIKINDCKIFPNPSNGEVNVLSNGIMHKITVNTILGQRVKEFYPNGTESNFIIQSNGIYLITIETEIGIQRFKIIIAN